ncbi:rod shape-determining protein MreD [Nocardioides terrisoli]|uniref:rod shape-determining protein MreD n=1 Tax=Nocardioides terrisoli TaxID=3388267 RepID=UPI00287B7913|nr:rod shape-determining protein MreD [Nocardioides marmorisolisilvae]
MNSLRNGAVVVLVLVAVVLQVAVLRYVSVDGVVPDLALLLVVAAGFVRGPHYAATLGFVAGLVLDLAPPADHVAGRWALALVVAGYLAGRVRLDARNSVPAALLAVAGCSFVASSIFALSGVVLGDDGLAAGQMLQVIVIGVVWDVLVAAVLLPPMTALLRRLRPARVAY